QRRLEAALADLVGGGGSAAGNTDSIGANTQKLLTGLNEVTTSSSGQTAPSTPPSESSGESDQTGQALRRASRLLSGFSSGPIIPESPAPLTKEGPLVNSGSTSEVNKTLPGAASKTNTIDSTASASETA